MTLDDLADRLRRHDEFGALHIVVSDGNIEDDDITHCLENPCAPLTQDDVDLARDLLGVPENMREKAWNLAFLTDFPHPPRF